MPLIQIETAAVPDGTLGMLPRRFLTMDEGPMFSVLDFPTSRPLPPPRPIINFAPRPRPGSDLFPAPLPRPVIDFAPRPMNLDQPVVLPAPTPIPAPAPPPAPVIVAPAPAPCPIPPPCICPTVQPPAPAPVVVAPAPAPAPAGPSALTLSMFATPTGSSMVAVPGAPSSSSMFATPTGSGSQTAKVSGQNALSGTLAGLEGEEDWGGTLLALTALAAAGWFGWQAWKKRGHR